MHPLLVTGLQMAAPLIKKRIEKKFIEGIVNEGIESTVEKTEISYEGVDKRKSAAWVVGIILLAEIARSMGYIDASVYQAIVDFVSNEAVQEAVTEATTDE